jgi:HEAT repeat protein
VPSSSNDLTSKLQNLFDAERTARRIHAELARADKGAVVPLIRKEIDGALTNADAAESAMRLVRLAALLGEMEGPAAVDALIDILACDEPEARHAAGESLEDLAFDRFKEVALGVERALERLPVGSPALSELPYLLAEVAEPGAAKLLGSFLRHKDPEAVAAAIEAIVEIGDPAAMTMLAPLEKDARQVQLDEDEGAESAVSIGDLATEARQLLADLGAKGDR